MKNIFEGFLYYTPKSKEVSGLTQPTLGSAKPSVSVGTIMFLFTFTPLFAQVKVQAEYFGGGTYQLRKEKGEQGVGEITLGIMTF